MKPNLIVGLGNLLLGDDGVGPHAVEALEGALPPHTEAADLGTAVLHMPDLLRHREKVLLIDAMQAGGRPGALYLMDLDEVADTEAPSGMHSMGVKTALRLMSEDERPGSVLLLGVEPERITYDMQLSPAVEAVLPDVCATALRTLEGKDYP